MKEGGDERRRRLKGEVFYKYLNAFSDYCVYLLLFLHCCVLCRRKTWV